jgi:hypothetical protein
VGWSYFDNFNIFYFPPRPAKLSTPQEGNLAQIHLRPKGHLLPAYRRKAKEDKKNYTSLFNPNTHSYQLAKSIVYYIGFFAKINKMKNLIYKFYRNRLGIVVGTFILGFGIKNILQINFNYKGVNFYIYILTIIIGVFLIKKSPKSPRYRRDIQKPHK